MVYFKLTALFRGVSRNLFSYMDRVKVPSVRVLANQFAVSGNESAYPVYGDRKEE